MAPKRNPGKDTPNPTDPNAGGALMTSKQNGQKRISYVQCANYKPGDPVFNVAGNITGMTDGKSPVSDMRMYYRSRKNAAPELNFDIDLAKPGGGEDERYVLSNEPTQEEKEMRVHKRLCQLESELQDVLEKLAFVKRLRTDWNAQKAGLCNRRLKDYPVCCKSDFPKSE